MLPFKLVYSDDYYLPIGAHVFPAEKYRLIHKRLLETALAGPSDFVTPQSASDEDILLVHTPEYVRKLKTGTLSPMEEMQMEVPYSPELVKAFTSLRSRTSSFPPGLRRVMLLGFSVVMTPLISRSFLVTAV